MEVGSSAREMLGKFNGGYHKDGWESIRGQISPATVQEIADLNVPMQSFNASRTEPTCTVLSAKIQNN